MSILSNNLEDSIALIHSKFQTLENDLSLVEEKVKNELKCVYEVEIFDLFENLGNTKSKISRLHQSLKDLYIYKKELAQVVKTQLDVLNSLSEFENVKMKVFTKESNRIVNFGKSLVEVCNSYFNLSEDKEIRNMFKKEIKEKKDEKINEKVEFVPIKEDQFDSVPILVKRRATLEQVNEVLEYLHKEALKKNRCVPVKISDISSQGIKVFGQTGNSKIAVLRYLKMIEIIKRDNTILLLDPRFRNNKTKKKF